MITVTKYSEEWRIPWDNFISISVNGNFLHSRGFYDHNPANDADECSFIFLKKNRIVAVLPCILYEIAGARILHSHLRSTFGGFVVSNEIGAAEAVIIVELIIKEARGLAVTEIIIRNPFRIFNTQPADETDYAMWFHGFSLKQRELEIAIDLQESIEVIQKRFENGTKYNIKKAEKSVVTVLSEDFEGFWKILDKNLQEKHGKNPVHSLPDLIRLREKAGKENIKLFAGYLDNKLICGTVVFQIGNRALHAQYIASDSGYQELRPINAVTDHIIKWGHANGFHYYNLGTANEEGGRVLNHGLFHFKESFGGRGVLRETMHLHLKDQHED
ncbi:MAG: GNAT family N-acetyltransferase [Ferruginibacter sp.]